MSHSTTNTSKHEASPAIKCLHDFFDALFDPTDKVEIRFLPPMKTKSNQWYQYTGTIVHEFKDIQERNKRQDVYFGVNPRDIQDGTAESVKVCRVVCADFDHTTPETARATIEKAGLPLPTVLVNSGHGAHAYWRLEYEIDPQEWRAIQRGLIKLLKCDDKIHDLPRIMRMPGTKHVAKHKEGEPNTYCEIVFNHTTRHDIEDIVRHLPPAEEDPPLEGESLAEGEVRPLPDHIAAMVVKGEKSGNRNNAAFKIAATYKAHGHPIETAKKDVALFAERCAPPLDRAEAMSVVRSAYSKDRTPAVDIDELPLGSAWQIASGKDVNELLDSELGQAAAKLARCEVDAQADKLDPKTPYKTAAVFIQSHYTSGSGMTLLHHRGDFYAHDGRAYREASDARIRSEVYPFVQPHYNATRNNVAGVIDAVKAYAYIAEDIDPPAWLTSNAGKPPAAELLPMANGLLHLPTRRLLEHDPCLFTLNALAFDYDPGAVCKGWMSFLDSIWGDDPEQIETLQEWVGYLISGLTNQQKIALLVGPKRSGKGTIARILAELIGPANCCNPTLNSLSQNFGMSPLIGKMSAVISDARLGGRADQHAITERLLNTSGEDPQTIDRKHRDPWTGKLGVRFTIMSNELPRLTDSSGALAGRFVVMMMKRSFYGREDVDLTNRLMAELPGVFNWALGGLDRLIERGHFIQPESSKDAIEELQDLASPIGAFVRDCIEVGPTDMPPRCDVVYDAWEKWCEDQGRQHPGTVQSFGRELRSALPAVQIGRPEDPITKKRYRVYKGISLKN